MRCKITQLVLELRSFRTESMLFSEGNLSLMLYSLQEYCIAGAINSGNYACLIMRLLYDSIKVSASDRSLLLCFVAFVDYIQCVLSSYVSTNISLLVSLLDTSPQATSVMNFDVKFHAVPPAVLH